MPKKAPKSLGQVLEAALVKDPDDLATHAAYADYLSEQGDPRGEFIQVQLALEDPKRPAKERKSLMKREVELMMIHQRAWLADLDPFLLDRDADSGRGDVQWQFRRGWLSDLTIHRLTAKFARALGKAPAARLLRQLTITSLAFDDQFKDYSPLLKAPFLDSLRIFRLGDHWDSTEGIQNSHWWGPLPHSDFFGQLSRLEELYLNVSIELNSLFALPTLTHLRVLQVYHTDEFPLEVLAGNGALGNLTRLSLQPNTGAYWNDRSPYTLAGFRALVQSPYLKSLTHLHLHQTNFGDAACEELVSSGVLKRLKVLDLMYGSMTDAGARLLAKCPDVKNLELLQLTRNGLSEFGIRALRKAVANVVADEQHAPNDLGYLYEGDME